MTNALLAKVKEFSAANYHCVQHNYKHFSFITRKNRIEAVGVNSPWKTHPVALKFGHRFASIHSELAAILSFPYPNRELKDCRMVNVRLSKEGDIKISKPCKNCMPMLAWAGVKEVWYSTNRGDFERL